MTPARPSPPVLVPSLWLAGFALFWFAHTVADPDLWGHVRFGQDIVRTRSVRQEDPYSYRTAGTPWINHEWLSEVIFAAAYDLAGPAGLVALKVAISLLIVGLGQAHLVRRGLGPYASALLLVALGVPFRMGLGTVRPQIFTYLATLLLLLVVERGTRGRTSWAWALPPLFVLWVNLHGGVLAGIGILGIWVVARLVDRSRDESRPPAAGRREAVALGLACGLATLVNPYGVGLPAFLLRTGTVPRPEISEWTPLALASFPGLIFLVLLAIGVVALAGSSRRRSPESVALFVVMAALPFFSSRHYPLFALALVVLAGEHLADAWGRRRPRAAERAGRSRVVAAAALGSALVLAVLAVPRFGCIRIDTFYFRFPARAVALLEASGVRGNMAVPFEWGEYVLWHLGPRVKVSMDGRRETVYSDAAYRQSIAFERGGVGWDALLRSSPTDLVLTQNGSPTVARMIGAEGWTPLYQDRCSVVFIRSGFPGLDRIVATPVPSLPDDGAGLCFPGPGRPPAGSVGRRPPIF